MFPIALIVLGVMFCGFVPCVGLSNAEAESSGVQEEQVGHTQAGQIIKGEVLRVEGHELFVKAEYGKEVRLHIDQTTKKGKKMLIKGELIEATVNEEGHALSIDSPDRKSEFNLDRGHVMEPPRK